MSLPAQPVRPSGPANDEEKLSIVNKYSAFVFDLDGTLWCGNELVPGAAEAVELLRSMGKKIFFVTNNSTKSRAQYLKKFQSLGMKASQSEIYGSAYIAAQYLRGKWFRKKVYCIGEAGIVDEMKAAGITAIGGPSDSDRKVDMATTSRMTVDKDVGAVVVGLDREVNYFKVQYALTCLLENEDCMFIATNTDARGNLASGDQEWAGAGTMVGAVIGASEKEPVVVGKPSTFSMDAICKASGLSYTDLCVVGDRLDTDILWGNSHGCGTLLVLTGITSEQMLTSEANTIFPGHYIAALGDMLSIKDKVPSSCVIS